MHVCWEDWKCMCLLLLCLELEAEAELVATSVDVLPIKKSRECQLDTCRNTFKKCAFDLDFFSYLVHIFC